MELFFFLTFFYGVYVAVKYSFLAGVLIAIFGPLAIWIAAIIFYLVVQLIFSLFVKS